jgi:hypothetical protein
MRTLIKIPIIHSAQDMGSLRDKAQQEYLARYGQEKWLDHLKSIDGIWLGIRQAIISLELPCAIVRLYQDGLPVCGKEADIVRDVAQQGSKNHSLLLELMAQGARLMGTEEPTLLLQEYQLHSLAPTQADASQAQTQAQLKQSQELLLARDRFIAERINQTLLTGEIGLLFLGLAHSIEALLSADILVRNLLPSLHEQAGASA